MAVGDTHVFPGFLTPVLTQLFLPTPPTTFLTCFCRGERQKYAEKEVRLNWRSNSQPPGHESDKPTNEPPGQDICTGMCTTVIMAFLLVTLLVILFLSHFLTLSQTPDFRLFQTERVCR